VDVSTLPLWLGTSKGAVTALTEAAQLTDDQRHLNPEACASDAWLAGALGPQHYLASQLARRLGSAMRPHHVAACASSLTALHQARQALQAQRCPSEPGQDADRALVVTSEAALLPLFIHSYRRLGVLAELTPGGYRQRPLDARRCGFILSEAGAAVVLRRLPAGQSPPAGSIELADTAIAADAHDMLRPSPAMPALDELAQRLIGSGPLEMLHPHAPGTAEHDPTELAIYRRILAQTEGGSRENGPDVYACKGAVGHGLGAAGLTALVLASLCLTSGQRPPMPWLEQPMDEEPGPSLHATGQRACSRTGRHAIFAAGFAGHTAGAVIERQGEGRGSSNSAEKQATYPTLAPVDVERGSTAGRVGATGLSRQSAAPGNYPRIQRYPAARCQ
jgi:3-oxoacyl-[acyl-carrier-protein] synthase II